MSRLAVQQCVVCKTIRQFGPNPTTDLLGMDYFYTVPADTEFPQPGNLELFVRFLGLDQPLRGSSRQSPIWTRMGQTAISCMNIGLMCHFRVSPAEWFGIRDSN